MPEDTTTGETTTETGSTTPETTAETTTETGETTTPTTDEKILKAIEDQNLLITESNRLLGVLAEQNRTLTEQGSIDVTAQKTQNESLDSIHTALTAPKDGGSAPDQLTALQEIQAHTESMLGKLDATNEQNYETGWLLAFCIVFAIGFKAFMDQATRW